MRQIKRNERVAIYIDGSNFYHYLINKPISFPRGVKFDFKKFAQWLSGNGKCVAKRYYTGIFRDVEDTEKGKSLVKGQQKFLTELENDGFTIKRGRILYDEGEPREKGTDVRIAVDLVVGAIDDLYDVALLVSSDTDLVPAIKQAKARGKKVAYVGFAHRPSHAMGKYADFSRLLKTKDIARFKGK